MNRHVIIPTTDASKAENLKEYFVEAGWDVHFVENAANIFDAHRKGLEDAGVLANDKVILCHDDIEILSAPKVFNTLIDNHLDDSQTGFIGVAGSAYVNHQINWFQCSKQNDSGGGIVFHGDSVLRMAPSFYGHRENVVVLDGLFLATTGKVLYGINMNKPKSFVSSWHHYDFSYCIQAHSKRLKNKTVPISILHRSPGSYNQSYFDDIPNVASVFDRYLPAVVN